LQVIAVTNFKGGSGKTTTTAHLAQYLALQGYRVLAIDLDPQASLSALFGYQPELDLSGNDTLYGAVRYDEARQRWVLLVPERVMAPDEIAVEILQLCDGQRSVAAIIDQLAEAYAAPREEIGADVIAMLQDLAGSGFVVEARKAVP